MDIQLIHLEIISLGVVMVLYNLDVIMLFKTSSLTRYLLMLVHALRSVAVALLSIVLGMSIISISQTASLLILMFPFGIPCSLRTLYHLQLWLELLHLLERKKKMLITRQTCSSPGGRGSCRWTFLPFDS